MTKNILLVLILAALLRLIGIYPGFSIYHEDEAFIYATTTWMLQHNSLEPFKYDYPATIPILQLPLYKFVFIPINYVLFYVQHLPELFKHTVHIHLLATESDVFINQYILGGSNAIIWSRYITALIGIGVVWLVYKITKNLFNEMSGLIAALFTSVNYRQVLNSHFGLPDIYNAFFLLLAFWIIIKLWSKDTIKNYLLGGITVGLSASMKYQPFALIPLGLVHLDNSIKKTSWLNRTKALFNPWLFVTVLLGLIIFVSFNIYLFINWQIAWPQLQYVALKYKTGKNFIDFFPISYLYHIGVGQITSFAFLSGLIVGIVKYPKKSLLLLSVIAPFLYVTIYYTGAGYYTRNFVTITPFLLIFAALPFGLIFQNKKLIPIILSLIILVVAVSENLYPSIIVAKEYTRPWNYMIMSDWLVNNIPKGSVIAVKPSPKIPGGDYPIVEFDIYKYFSEDEFRDQGAVFSIVNLGWVTGDLVWWMSQGNSADSLRYWDNPNHMLNLSYQAMSIAELSRSTIYSVIKDPRAIEVNFFATKIPIYKLMSSELSKAFNFSQGSEGWFPADDFWFKDANAQYLDGSLGIIQTQTVKSSTFHWQSPELFVRNWQGFDISYEIKTKANYPDIRDGFVFAEFYANESDAKARTNRLAVRLSSRNMASSGWQKKDLIGQVPQGAVYMIIGFQPLLVTKSDQPGPDSSIFIKNVQVYQAQVSTDYQGWQVNPLKLSPEDLFRPATDL